MEADSVRPTGMPAKYWIYFVVVIFGIPTLIDAWSVTTFLVIVSGFGIAFAIAIANYVRANYKNEVQTLPVHNAAPAQGLPSPTLAESRPLSWYDSAVVWSAWHESSLIRSEFIITQHTPELIVRRRQLTTTSNYGLVDDSQWLQEVEFFIDEVIDKSGGEVRSSTEQLCTVRKMIDIVTARFVSSRAAFSPDMDPIEYEQMVADSLTDLGWVTKLTKASGDQGIDVIAEMRGERVVIQCKRYASSIGNSAVQEAFAGKSFEGADYAAVVTNAEFTRSARQLADTTHVILLHHDELSKLELQIFGTVGTNAAAAKDGSSSGASLMYMTPVCYEQSVADGLKKLGWQTRLKNTNEDHYADVIAEMRGKRVMIQCWGFMLPCIPGVGQLHAAKLFENADFAAIVSNAELASDGRQLAKIIGVVLLRHDELAQLEQRIFGSDAGRDIATRAVHSEVQDIPDSDPHAATNVANAA
jgi:HJR/Mrr/RecB family endonuclease